MGANITARGNRMAERRQVAQEAQPKHVVSIEQCALGLYWAWVWLFYESDALFAGTSGDFAIDSFRFVSLLAMGAALLIGAVAHRTIESNRGVVVLSAVAVFCGPVGLACALLPGFFPTPLAGAVLVGAAEGALAFLWASFLMRFPAQRSYQAYSVAISVVIGAVAFLVISHLPWPWLPVADAYLPVTAGVICLASRIFKQSVGTRESAASTDKRVTPARGFFYPTAADGDQLPEYNNILVRVFSALAVYGLIYGVLRAYATSSNASSADVATALFLVVGICLGAYVRSARFDSLTLFWRLIFPVTLIGIVLTPLYGNPGGFLAAPIAQTGYLLFESLVWIILFDVVAQLRLNGIAVFGVGRGITALAMAIGSFAPDQLLGGAFASFLAENALPVLIVAIIVLAVVNFFVLNEREVAIAGLLEIRDDDRAQLAEIADKGQVSSNMFDRISERYQLTNREREVLELLSAGKSGPQISEMLVLSKATVKTHTYNIYKKLEVHTRAELLAFVQDFR